MEQAQQLEQLLGDDLPSLSAYYGEMAAEQGAGVLSVNYYPSGGSAQMEAKFLKASSIPKLARQMGLATLQVEFSRHNPHTQMVVALITAETKGVITVELASQQAQTPVAALPQPQTSEIQTQSPELAQRESKTAIARSSNRKSDSKTSSKRKSSTKITTQPQQSKPSGTETPVTQTPQHESQSPKPTAEPETTSELVTQPETITGPTAEPEVTPTTLGRVLKVAKMVENTQN